MRIISYILISIFFFFIGLNYWHKSEWMRGYCWGYIEGRLEEKMHTAYKHNVLAVMDGFIN